MHDDTDPSVGNDSARSGEYFLCGVTSCTLAAQRRANLEVCVYICMKTAGYILKAEKTCFKLQMKNKLPFPVNMKSHR